MRYTLLAAAAALLLGGSVAQAQSAKRADLLKQFEALTTVHSKAVKAPGVVQKLSDGTIHFTGPKYNPVDPVPPPVPGPLAIKVWAQVAEGPHKGQFVHPEKYKWQRKERFYMWFETSTPVYVGLWQDYAGMMPSRKVLPDERFPQSYSAILPGQPFQFPVLLEMDDNLIDEFMAIEVVSATGDLKINQPTAVVMDPGGQTFIDKGVKKSHEEYLAKRMAEAKKAGTGKFNPSTMDDITNPGVPPTSTKPEDVAIIAVGREGFGHIQLRLKKD